MIVSKLRELLGKESVRFLVSGGFNTFVTWLLYLALDFGLVQLGVGRVLAYEAAYTLSFVVGIALAYWLNTKWVFETPMSLRTMFQFPLVYVVQLGAGEALLFGLIEGVGCPKSVAPLVVTVLTLPITFVLSRFILKEPA
jgi:putative flippase GtrA